ncbi:MAG: hypothetical protein FJ128_00720 [Deltaproteobacteria bacterium]|nr:hypothetical protein [Deltaproteobacteria bacterium]
MRRWPTLVLAGLMVLTCAPQAFAWAWAQTSSASLDQFQEEAKRTRLGPAIGVDQRTVDLLIQIDRRYKPLKAKLTREMSSDLHRLRQLLQNPNPGEDEVRTILHGMFQKRQETLALQQKQLEEEMAVLTPVQQARYLIFLMGLRQQMAKEALNLRGAPGGSRPPQGGAVGEIPAVQPSR